MTAVIPLLTFLGAYPWKASSIPSTRRSHTKVEINDIIGLGRSEAAAATAKLTISSGAENPGVNPGKAVMMSPNKYIS